MKTVRLTSMKMKILEIEAHFVTLWNDGFLPNDMRYSPQGEK